MKKIDKIKSKSIIILSLLFSFFMIFGNSYKKINSWDLVFGNTKNIITSIIFFIIYFIIFKFVLNFIYYKLDKCSFNNDKFKNSKFNIIFEKHPFVISLIVIIICWMPYIVSFYPAILSPDPSFQIRQFFGIANKYSTYSILIDENVLITNHHPVIHTLLLGGCVKLGVLIGSVNKGLFLYSIIQIIILASVLSFTIHYMKKINLPHYIRKYSLFIYALVPAFPFYAMSIVKDVIFGSLIILYIILIYDFIKNREIITNKKVIFSILLIILLILFRNNGVHVFVLSFPFLLIKNMKNIFKLSVILFIPLFMYTGYSKILLPLFKITPTSIRESLSIPFQQTARYVIEYGNEMDKDEIEIVDNLLHFDTLALRYKPEISDTVKSEFNRFYTDDDLKKYFEVWFSGLKRHPDVYVQATMNNTYGYFYPLKTSWYIYHNFDKRITENGFDYHYNDLSTGRTLLSIFGIIFPYIPVLGLFVNIGFNVWVLLIMTSYLIYRKKYREILFLLPALILLLVCIASPVNTYFRYALPFIFGMPLMIGMFIDTIKK